MSNSFDVYVGNLSVTISREKLREMFSKIGKILFVWINQVHQRFTYAFVAFYHLSDAKKACVEFNNQNLNGFIIKVNLSIKTQLKLDNSVRKKTSDLLLELPKRTGKKIPTKEDKLREILRDNLKKQDEKFVRDFINATTEAENVCIEACEIKTEPEKTDLTTLENTVIRYFKPASKKVTLFKEVDLDISKDNVLKSEQNDNLFKIFRH